jgi:glycosyltransferase involved in cell wall biosynthesis
MRFVFLIPDLDITQNWQIWSTLICSTKNNFLNNFLNNFSQFRRMRTSQLFGGTLNLMRHCLAARQCGLDAVLATIRGKDTYGDFAIPGLPFIRWADRRPDDICIVPDFVSDLADNVKGSVIVYQQSPLQIHTNFNYRPERVSIWTDSPHMHQLCETVYPGKIIEIVPNIVDDKMFPFISQAQREQGLLVAFPRKGGAEFIQATEKNYQALGGKFWSFQLLDGLSIHDLAKEFRRPQVFLASVEAEGCALPPQESMAAGIVVVGKNAKGANFCMEHKETAMIAETPKDAAQCLIELEDAELRERLARNAYAYIQRYFPAGEPQQFWQTIAHRYCPERYVEPVKAEEVCVKAVLDLN